MEDRDSPLLTPDEKPLLTPEAGDRAATVRAATRRPLSAAAELPPGATNGERPLKALRREDSATVGEPMTISTSKKYERMEKVGTGAYGSVFKARNEVTREIVAIKVASRKEDPIYGGFPLSVLREIGILQHLSHENIVKMYEVANTPQGDPLLVMEFCQASLLELLNSRKHKLSFSEVKYISRQLLDATKHMHERGVLHRDLATKNVLFNLSGEIKVCDFGISRMGFCLDEEFGLVSARELENPNMIVSLPYRAIELLLGDSRYGPALDVWSVACILGEILLCQAGKRQTFFGGEPGKQNRDEKSTVEEVFRVLGKPTEETWPGLERLPLLKSYASAKLDAAKRHGQEGDEVIFVRRFFVSGDGSCANSQYSLTDRLFDLLGGLFCLCPARRLGAAQALSHPWFAEKPVPEWHSRHWANIASEIPRGDAMMRQPQDEGDKSDTRALLRQLTKAEELKVKEEDERCAKSVKENVREQMQGRAQQRRLAEEKQQAAKKAEAARQQAKLDSAKVPEATKMPPGWTKQWSNSKKKYYYHDSRTGKNQWVAPSR